MNYKLTDEERDRIRNATETNSPHDRLDELAEIMIDVGGRLGVEDLEQLSHYIGVYEVVGTGLGMSLPTVLSHLSELLEIHEGGDIPNHGGSEEFHEGISLNERFDHNCYYALQTLYGNMIYGRIKDTHEYTSNTELSRDWHWGIAEAPSQD